MIISSKVKAAKAFQEVTGLKSILFTSVSIFSKREQFYKREGNCLSIKSLVEKSESTLDEYIEKDKIILTL